MEHMNKIFSPGTKVLLWTRSFFAEAVVLGFEEPLTPQGPGLYRLDIGKGWEEEGMEQTTFAFPQHVFPPDEREEVLLKVIEDAIYWLEYEAKTIRRHAGSFSEVKS